MTPPRLSRVLLAATLAAGFGLRLWLAIGNYGNYDQTSFRIVAEIMERGGNVYAETTRYNYAPLWAWLLLALLKVSQLLGAPLYATVKVFLVLVDAGNTALVGVIAGRVRPGAGALAAGAYALNPVAVMLVGHHGQIEPLAALPLLGAIALVLGPASPRRQAAIWGLVVLSLLAKHIVFFIAFGVLVFAFRGVLKPILAFGGALVVFGLSFLPFVSSGREGIVRNVLGYAGAGFHRYGLAVLPRPLSFALLFGVLLALPFVARDRLKIDAARTASLLAVGTMALLPRMGENYLLVPALFGSLDPGLGWAAFAGVGYYFLLHGPNNLQALPGPFPFALLWATLFGWFLLDLVRASRRRA